jgi:hypothetical protein
MCAAHEYIFYSRTTSIIAQQNACVNSVIGVFFTTQKACGKRRRLFGLVCHRQGQAWIVNVTIKPYIFSEEKVVSRLSFEW